MHKNTHKHTNTSLPALPALSTQPTRTPCCSIFSARGFKTALLTNFVNKTTWRIKTAFVGDHFYNLPNFADIVKLTVSEESTESVDLRNLVCRSVALIYVEFWLFEKRVLGQQKKSGFACTTRKRGNFENGEIWGNFAGCGATTIRVRESNCNGRLPGQ